MILKGPSRTRERGGPLLDTTVTFHALACPSWQIHHHTDDVPRQLDRAERVLDRYEA